ncbi:MAG TPA: DUF222 domain-containing protein [Mycobacteriales bacterium]|nr:DUF222 domain-containing protein [Mycobacteriales bacterium]
MMLMVDVPDELFASDAALPPVLSPDGAALDRVASVPAGPWLAVLLGCIDPRTLTEHDLALYVEACGRLENWSASLVNDAVDEWARRPHALGVAQKVAFALHEPVQTAERRIWVARTLRRLPRTRARFRCGDLPAAHVARAAQAVAHVDDLDLLDAAEQKVWRRGVRNSARELGRAFRDALGRLDPAGASERAERASAEGTDVILELGDDGMATVVAPLPVEDALTVKAAADGYAFAAKNAGDARPVGVLRGEGLARFCGEWLTGATRGLIVPASPNVSGRSQQFCDGTAGDGDDLLRGDRVGRPPTAGRRPIEIAVVIGLRTALGLDELPGEIPGHGIVPRSAVETLIARERPRLRMLIVDESSGRLLHRAQTSYRPTAAQYAHLRAAYPFSVGPGSSVLSARCDVDHTDSWPNSATRIGELVPICRPWHNAKTRREMRMRLNDDGTVTWTTATGQSRTVEPDGYRVDAPAEPRP